MTEFDSAMGLKFQMRTTQKRAISGSEKLMAKKDAIRLRSLSLKLSKYSAASSTE